MRSSSFIVSRAGGPLRLLTLALWFSASMFIANAWAANLGPLQSAPGTRITARLGPWAPARQSSATDTSRAPMGYYSRLPHIRRPASGVRRPAFFGSPNYSADSILRDDYLANDDQIGSGQHIGPRLAFDSAGNCVVTWQDTRNGDLDIYAQRLDYSGSRVGTNFRVVDDPDMWYQGTPAVGVAQGGSFMIAWEDRRGGKSDVYTQRYGADGTPIDTNWIINENTSGDKRGATVTYLPGGRSVTAWEDWRLGDNGHIFAQVLGANGQPKGRNFWVNDTTGWQAYAASIGSDASGNFVVTWEDARQGWDVWAQRYDSLAKRLGDNFRVNSVINVHIALPTPSVGVAQDGSFVIVWNDYRDDSLAANVYAQRYNQAGAPLGPNFRVNDSLHGVTHSSPTACFDAQDNFIVTWIDTRNGRSDIYAQAFDDNGQRLGANFRVNDNAGPLGCGNPNVRYSPRSEFWITWDDSRAGTPEVYGQRLAADRTPIGGNFKINDDSLASQQYLPTVDARGNRIVTIWEDTRANPNEDIYCRISDSLGNPIGANLKANDDNVGAEHFYSTAALDFAGNSITAWTDGRSGVTHEIYAQAFDAAGNRLGANFKVNDNSGTAEEWSPSAARDSDGHSLIVFQDGRLGGPTIYGQRYDAQNRPVGPNFRIGDSAVGWQEYALVAAGFAGRFMVVWMDTRDNNSIYGQLVDSSGAPIGANFRVNDDWPIASFHGDPCVAGSPDRGFAVVWDDDRDSIGENIYAQRFDRNGSRVGKNFRVNDDATTNDHFSPSCAFDLQGRLAAVWTDYRNPAPNAEIYSQRYNANGSPLSYNKVVNDPDFFYYDHHWTNQKSVAAGNDRLVFSWIENRRHQGWDIYDKITDWNLVGISEKAATTASRALTLSVRPNPLPANRLAPSAIRLSLPVREHVRLTLYDASGRAIRRLYDGMAESGEIELPLDVRALSAGPYFLVAHTAEKNATEKLVITEAQ